jgi:hypothetical protein
LRQCGASILVGKVEAGLFIFRSGLKNWAIAGVCFVVRKVDMRRRKAIYVRANGGLCGASDTPSMDLQLAYDQAM